MLKLRYRRAGEAEARPRKVAPLGLVLKGGIWYLIAQHEKSIRTYRAGNIQDAEVRDESFIRPKAFDLALYWAKAARDYEAGVYHEHADVRLSPKGMLLLELLGPHVTEAASRTAGKPDRHGWQRCTLPLESVDFGVRESIAPRRRSGGNRTRRPARANGRHREAHRQGSPPGPQNQQAIESRLTYGCRTLP